MLAKAGLAVSGELDTCHLRRIREAYSVSLFQQVLRGRSWLGRPCLMLMARPAELSTITVVAIDKGACKSG